jgi:tRNA (guanine-N7-)-methyltransferase
MRRADRLPLEQLQPYLLAPPWSEVSGADHPEPLRVNWSEVFGNDHPVEIEVGFAKGLFLLNASQAHPEVNFVGIEILRKFQLYAATRFAKRHLCNVRVMCTDARAFFHHHVGDASVQAIHIYFPDPWWKKRHHKRRIFTPAFVADCARILWPGGYLHIVTDVGEYAQLIREMVAGHPVLVAQPPPEASEPAHDLDYLTNFERKFRKQGRAIHRMCYRCQAARTSA